MSFLSLTAPAVSPSNFGRSAFVSWGLDRVEIHPRGTIGETLVQSFSGRGHLLEK